ncbi:hypothetical protein N7462_007219 [Penicillium macrosclerotiorum]|uniref:uncharacterized protein n=1 Tax=Penicillium macrosclerotiorum TaxID=303699 RepID=UPI002546F2A8|nr:uncharacterized protein N7462_007219 [Penicillium macrosclerotiorum]KAJ5678975.1 hypothetical protein N7462_007219 [Penicillium macrosclerotiorum]
MAVRRSARLRSASAQPSPAPEAQEITPRRERNSRLTSVEERDETPGHDRPAIRTPITQKYLQKTPTTSAHVKVIEARTPTSNSAARPPREEMHPSKAQQSTTKQADTGLILGFNPIRKDAEGNIMKNDLVDNTPSKSKASPAPSQFGTPGYEFKFGQDSQLSDEAKQLMNSVREDVARIKAEMKHSQSKQDAQDLEAEYMHGDRKIAKPKGKASRFSDIHMAEFKKMDSIAGHASSFRATPGRFHPVTKSLKRTKSKAQLDEVVEPHNQSPSRSPAKLSTVSLPAATTPTAKRVKPNPTEKIATALPQSEKKNGTVHKPAGPRSRPSIRSSLMTPTRASMARFGSTSLKAPKTSLIPSLARSPSTKGLASPRTPRTEFNPRLKSNLPTLGNLKSILRRRQPLFSRDPSRIAAGTHITAPDFDPDSLLDNRAEMTDSGPTPSPKKHVEFTPSVKSRFELAQGSPTRSKIPTTPSRSSNLSQITYPTLPTLTPEHSADVSSAIESHHAKSPSIRHVRQSEADEQEAVYPELSIVTHGIAHGIGNKKRHRDEVDDDDLPQDEDTENVPPKDTQSEERGAKRQKANPPTPSPIKSRSIKTPVRPSSIRVSTPTSTTASTKQKSRGVLSLSRLNMLAKPKGRV